MCNPNWLNIDNKQVVVDLPMALKIQVPFNLVFPDQEREREVKISVGEEITTLRSHDDIYKMSSVNHENKNYFINISNKVDHLSILDRGGHSLLPQHVKINTTYLMVDRPYKICRSTTGNENCFFNKYE